MRARQVLARVAMVVAAAALAVAPTVYYDMGVPAPAAASATTAGGTTPDVYYDM